MLRRSICAIYKLSLQKNKTKIIIPSTNYFTAIQKYSTNQKTNEKDLKFDSSEANVFGTLNPKTITKDELQDEGDIKEQEFLENPPNKKLRTKQYADIIKKYLEKRQIQEAINVLEIRMIKEDRVKPENYIYNLILGGCGRVGYTKKAFKLFNDMKKRGLKPTGGTYTALFNACANSPWPEDGLLRATKLKALMFEKGFIPNDTTYNSMIKAFGRCGDIKTSFNIVDEMIQNQIPIKTDVINFLLQSCITQKETGFLHALLVWNKFKENKINPDVYSFNLLLHCIRECGIGDPEIAKKLLEETVATKHISSNEIKLISSPEIKMEIIDSKSNNLEIVSNEVNSILPNLLSENPHLETLGNMVKMEEIQTAAQRLLLVGGFSGFLQTMKNNNVEPDIKTYTILLHNMPSTLAAEQTLLTYMKKRKVFVDIDFLNMLIKKRCFRKDYENARNVLDLFDKYHLRPDLFTYGILALTCQTIDESRMLLDEIDSSGYRLNIEILGGFLKQAVKKNDFPYVLHVMEIVVDNNIEVSKKFLEILKDFHEKCLEIEKTGMNESSFFKKGFHLFCMRYNTWKKLITPDKSEEAHPWEQFRNPVETKVKNYKDPKEYYKPRRLSRFRVKTKNK